LILVQACGLLRIHADAEEVEPTAPVVIARNDVGSGARRAAARQAVAQLERTCRKQLRTLVLSAVASCS